MRAINAMKLATALVLFAPAAFAEEAEKAKTGMPQLDPTWIPSQLFWLTITFGLLYVLSSRHIIPTVERVLKKRNDKLTLDIGIAESLKTEAEAAHVSYEKAEADARAKSEAMIAKVQAEAAASLAAEQAALDEKLKAQMTKADLEIQAKLAKAQSDIAPAAAGLASEITKKLLGKSIDSAEMVKHIERAKA